MHGALPVKLYRLSVEVPQASELTSCPPLPPPHGAKARSDSGSGQASREMPRALRLRKESRPGRAVEEAATSSVPSSPVVLGQLHGRGVRTDGLETRRRNLEEFVQQDLDAFWRWCPAPADGLHRCGLLAKLFDYCGLTHKHHKVTEQLLRLDRELLSLGIVGTEKIQANQRVLYEAFVQSRLLREAVVKCSSFGLTWKHVRWAGKTCEEAKAPLAVWVWRTISPEEAIPSTPSSTGTPSSPLQAV